MKVQKKIILIVLLCAVAFTAAFNSLAEDFFQAEFMNSNTAEKTWGLQDLDKKAFRSGDLKKRAPMAVAIVKNKIFVGQSMKLVRRELGDPDSYFFSDTIYAYKIIPFPGRDKENWHLVFIPDERLENVKEVKIHKKCCYKLPF